MEGWEADPDCGWTCPPSSGSCANWSTARPSTIDLRSILQRKRLISAIPLWLLAGVTGACSQEATQQAANFVYTDGTIYTVDRDNPSAEAMAVRGTTVVYVADAAGAEAFVGDATTVEDLGGRFVMPGMPVKTARGCHRCQLPAPV